MIMIVEIIISIVMLFICICVVYHYFIKQLNELENRILVLEKRINESDNKTSYFIEDLYKGIQCKTEDINALDYKINKLEKKVNKNEK